MFAPHLLNELPLAERHAVELRFGLNDGRPRTLEEVAELTGFSRDELRQLEAPLLRSLRRA